MKANRKFRNAEEGVSPVIAVILMVAITVVLAATLFVLLDLYGKQTAAPVAFGWDEKQDIDRAAVTNAPSGSDWSDYQVRVTACTQPNNGNATIYVGDGASPYFNEESDNDGGALNTPLATGTSCGGPLDVRITTTTNTNIEGGDHLDFCATVAVEDVTIVFATVEGSQLVSEFTFESIAVCP